MLPASQTKVVKKLAARRLTSRKPRKPLKSLVRKELMMMTTMMMKRSLPPKIPRMTSKAFLRLPRRRSKSNRRRRRPLEKMAMTRRILVMPRKLVMLIRFVTKSFLAKKTKDTEDANLRPDQVRYVKTGKSKLPTSTQKVA